MSKFQQSRQPVQHPRLRPAHVGRADGVKASALVVEEAARVAQIIDGPMSDFFCESERATIKLLEFRQSHESRARRMRVRRVESIMEIFGPAVRKKKRVAPEFVALPRRRFKLNARGGAGIHNAGEARPDKGRGKNDSP